MTGRATGGAARAAGERPATLGWPAATTFVAFVAVALFDGGQGPLQTAAIAIAVWWAIAVALIAAGRVVVPRSRGAFAACSLTVIAVAIGLSAGWASDDGRVYVELIRALAYLGVLLILLIGIRAGGGRGVLTGLAAAVVAIAALAVGSRLVPELLTGDATFLSGFPEATRGRLGYPIGYWNGLAACMAGTVVLLAWIGAAAPSARGRSLAVAALPLVVLTIYLTGSRGGVLAAIAGSALLLALTPVRSRVLAGLALGGVGGLGLALIASGDQVLVEGASGREVEWPLLAAIALISVLVYALRRRADTALFLPDLPRGLDGRGLAAAAVIVAGALFVIGDGAERIEQFDERAVGDVGRGELSGRFLEGAGSGRLQLWETALEAAAEQPLHGVGAGAYGYYWNQNGSLNSPTRDAHSLPLEMLAELGPVGLLAVLGLFGAGFAASLRRTFGDLDGTVAACAGLLATATISAAVDWTWEIPAAFAMALVAIGLLCGRATGEGRRVASELRPRRAWQLPAVGLSLAIVLASGALLLSERSLDRSRDLAAEGNLAAAATAARDAARFQPQASEPWLQLGLIQGLAGDRRAAGRSLRTAVRKAPEDPEANLALLLHYERTADPRRGGQLAVTLFLLPRNREINPEPQVRPCRLLNTCGLVDR